MNIEATVIFGGAAALVAASMIGWTFRTSTAPLPIKLAGPALLCSFAVCSPYVAAGLMGYPVPGSLSELPPKAQLVAFVEAPDGKVDLWVQANGEPPRAWHVEEPAEARQQLAQARVKLGHGEPVYVQADYGIKGQKFKLVDSWLPRKD